MGHPEPAGAVRARPPLFRALGKNEPPARIEVGQRPCSLVRVIKHDSWAATALYEGDGRKVICKFNRQQPVGKLPMAWLGRYLARREAGLYRRLADLPLVPDWAGEVCVGGKPLHHAVAHVYVPGHPLGEGEKVNDDFFPLLEGLLAEVHARDIAYVDLHKRENILVGDNGRPYLIDFQISLALAPWFPAKSLLTVALLRLFQQADAYHLRKHIVRHRPDLVGHAPEEVAIRRPWWIRLHRLVGRPLRFLRRRLLVALKIRSGLGRAESERFPEEGLRRAA
jgi:hypothetical protein